MKKALFIMTAILLIQNGMAAQKISEAQVPAPVTQAFHSKFPDSKVQKWESRKEGYIARFHHEGRTWFAYYAADGTWKGTETPIKWTRNLPDAVKAGWKNSGYYNWKVED